MQAKGSQLCPSSLLCHLLRHLGAGAGGARTEAGTGAGADQNLQVG